MSPLSALESASLIALGDSSASKGHPQKASQKQSQTPHMKARVEAI